jgi:hypothetical protein
MFAKNAAGNFQQGKVLRSTCIPIHVKRLSNARNLAVAEPSDKAANCAITRKSIKK